MLIAAFGCVVVFVLSLLAMLLAVAFRAGKTSLLWRAFDIASVTSFLALCGIVCLALIFFAKNVVFV